MVVYFTRFQYIVSFCPNYSLPTCFGTALNEQVHASGNIPTLKTITTYIYPRNKPGYLILLMFANNGVTAIVARYTMHDNTR